MQTIIDLTLDDQVPISFPQADSTISKIYGFLKKFISKQKYWTIAISKDDTKKNILFFAIYLMHQTCPIEIKLNCSINITVTNKGYQLNFEYSQDEIGNVPLKLLLKESSNEQKIIAEINQFLSENQKKLPLKLSLHKKRVINFTSSCQLTERTLRQEIVSDLLKNNLEITTHWVLQIYDYDILFNLSVESHRKKVMYKHKKQFIAQLATLYKKKPLDRAEMKVAKSKLEFLNIYLNKEKNHFLIINKSCYSYSKTYSTDKPEHQIGVGIQIVSKTDIVSDQDKNTFNTCLSQSGYQNAEHISLKRIQFRIDENCTVGIGRSGSIKLQCKWSQNTQQMDAIIKSQRISKNTESNEKKSNQITIQNKSLSVHSQSKQGEQVFTKTPVSNFLHQKTMIFLISNLKCEFIAKHYVQQEQFNELILKREEGDLYNLMTKIKKKKQKLSIKLFLKIFQQIAKGLYVLYQNNYLHRDLKSTNVLITDKQNAKIIDFGSAFPINKNYNANVYEKLNGALKSTVGYHLSYQQAKQGAPSIEEAYDQKQYNQHILFDIYSLGKIIADALELSNQFNDNFFIHAIKKLISICTEIDPEHRMKHGQILYFLDVLQNIYVENNTIN